MSIEEEKCHNAVYDHMLQQSRLRFLLADDAGAGKTIMTGLYIREMLTRRLISRVLIVPPAGLVGNWEHELQHLFNLSFSIVNGSDAKTGNPFIGPESDRLIVSVDTLRGDAMFSRLQEAGVVPKGAKNACDIFCQMRSLCQCIVRNPL